MNGVKKLNKKSIGIIIAVIFVLFVGIVGGTDNSNDSALNTTQNNVIASSDSFAENDISDGLDVSSDEPSTTTKNDKPTEDKKPEPSSENTTKAPQNKGEYKVKLSSIPEFSGKPYVAVNNNIPGLSREDRTANYFEKYTALDYLERCGVAFACLGKETMPTEDRGAIGSVKPSGWHTVKYDFVDGKYLYNRCHLIGFQLSGENANTRNLITGTRYMNVDGMLPFENMVADYIKETGNHVLYRVTPVFKGSELVCRGVQIEAFSVEDNGDGICFNVFCYNNQPGVEIDYATGNSRLSAKSEATTQKREPTTAKVEKTTQKPTTQPQTQSSVSDNEAVYIPKSGKRYHSDPTCSGMKEPRKVSIKEAQDLGYTACGRCY